MQTSCMQWATYKDCLISFKRHADWIPALNIQGLLHQLQGIFWHLQVFSCSAELNCHWLDPLPIRPALQCVHDTIHIVCPASYMHTCMILLHVWDCSSTHICILCIYTWYMQHIYICKPNHECICAEPYCTLSVSSQTHYMPCMYNDHMKFALLSNMHVHSTCMYDDSTGAYTCMYACCKAPSTAYAVCMWYIYLQ